MVVDRFPLKTELLRHFGVATVGENRTWHSLWAAVAGGPFVPRADGVLASIS
jgi:hypothetical protein